MNLHRSPRVEASRNSVRAWRVVRESRLLAECYVQRETDEPGWLLTVYRNNETLVAETHASSEAAMNRAEELYRSLGAEDGWMLDSTST
jgi:hypothetical protein